MLISTALLITSFCNSCRTPNSPYNWSSRQIPVGAGPEDLLLDTFGQNARLLVSCDARRKGEPAQAGIWAIDLESQTPRELPRQAEPADLAFHPHGIDISAAPENSTAQAMLYVISHDDERDLHEVLLYEVHSGHLLFSERWSDPLLVSPNALSVLDDGTVLVTNDSGKRGSYTEALFKRRRSNVVARSAQSGQWSVAADDLAYANGICSRAQDVFVATTRQNRIFSYRWDPASAQLSERQELAKVRGADNLRWDGHHLLVPGHPSILAFVRHAGSAKRSSPVEVWRVDSRGPSPAELIYADRGKTISGAATALRYKDKIYLSQVFDPFVLVLEGAEPEYETR